jgi:hypothetical protein
VDSPAALIFDKMFGVTKRDAATVIPPDFLKSAKALFSNFPSNKLNDVSFLENQTIIITHNKFTSEESMFNEVRRYRPGYAERVSPENEAKLVEMNEASKGPETCDFCSVVRTAADIFGRSTLSGTVLSFREVTIHFDLTLRPFKITFPRLCSGSNVFTPWIAPRRFRT